MSVRTAWYLFATTLAVAVAHMVWAQGVLTEHMASHFGVRGEADGSSGRVGFLVSYAVVMAVMAGTFGGFSLLLPRLPDSVINIPRREYWLAPERRDATHRHFTAWYLMMGMATNLFLIVTHHLVVQANIGLAEPRLNGVFWLAFAAYMLFVVVWTVRLWASYRRIEVAAP